MSNQCPSCGAPVTLSDERARSAYCAYCSQPLVVLPEGFEIGGSKAALHEMPTVVKVGQTCSIGGATLQVLGQVQYAFEDGVYNHFYLVSGDAWFWLEQDEGKLKLYDSIRQVSAVPDFEDLGVGENVAVDGGSFYPMEFDEGSVIGGVGSLPIVLMPGQTFNYADGTWNGQAASLDYTLEGVWLKTGRALEPRHVAVVG